MFTLVLHLVLRLNNSPIARPLQLKEDILSHRELFVSFWVRRPLCFTSAQLLGNKLIDKLLLNRINSTEHIKQYVLSAWWCGQGPPIHPSFLKIKSVHQLSHIHLIQHHLTRCVLPFQTLKILVYHLNNFLIDFWSIQRRLINWKYNSNDWV